MATKARFIVAVFALYATAAFAQDGRFDVSANMGAIFTKSSTGNSITQSATVGGNPFFTFRYKLAPKHSVVFTYGRGRDSQTYRSSFDFHEITHITEYSGAYMFSPFQKGRFQPFATVGAGVLKFNPQSTWVILPDYAGNIPNRVQTSVGATSQTRPAFLYGVGVDYTLPRVSHFALRLQYRGFLYSNPDFNVNSSTSSVSFFTGTKGHMAEPSLGLVFRF